MPAPVFGQNFQAREWFAPFGREGPSDHQTWGREEMRAAEVVNQPQGLQAVKPDHGTDAGGARDPASSGGRPANRLQNRKIEIRLKAGMDFSAGQDGLRSRCPDRLHPGKPFPEDRENSGIMEAVFVRPPFMNRSIRCPTPKGTPIRRPRRGKTDVVP